MKAERIVLNNDFAPVLSVDCSSRHLREKTRKPAPCSRPCTPQSMP